MVSNQVGDGEVKIANIDIESVSLLGGGLKSITGSRIFESEGASTVYTNIYNDVNCRKAGIFFTADRGGVTNFVSSNLSGNSFVFSTASDNLPTLANISPVASITNAGVYLVSSDRRLKRNISQLNEAELSDEILSTDFYQFEYEYA